VVVDQVQARVHVPVVAAARRGARVRAARAAAEQAAAQVVAGRAAGEEARTAAAAFGGAAGPANAVEVGLGSHLRADRRLLGIARGVVDGQHLRAVRDLVGVPAGVIGVGRRIVVQSQQRRVGADGRADAGGVVVEQQ